MATMNEEVVQFLATDKCIKDSFELATKKGWDHEKLIGFLKSLEAEAQVINEPSKKEGWKLTAEGEKYSKDGSPEVLVFNKVLAAKGAATNASLDAELGETAKIGMSTAMKNKWIAIDKATKTLSASVASVVDEVQKSLQNYASLPKDQLDALKKRKLVAPTSLTLYKTTPTASFDPNMKKASGALTMDMILKGTWNDTKFKEVNLNSVSGTDPCGGHLHPLSKVRTEIRNVLTLMGFEEMKTNQWVESSFWNFDSLFQPQQHPARDAHDTFFVENPSRAQNLPPDYLAAVKQMHESGGKGSIGWRYDWSEDEARKNILRTHTTSVSARTLHALAEDYKRTGTFTAKKCFSIDRVFRNETLDATHLAEFHQVEGFVADRNLGLGHLIGVLKEFFKRVGISRLRFKPAYNPYTEPSMEIFGFHPILKKWIEVGNSGVFRPEMLLPMGLPEDVTVVAWGIGLERWAALLYNVRYIKDLFSYQQDIAASKKNPVCWLKRAEELTETEE
eukprot:TRINITY_DN74166_c0_g1_i1.p1 TRINITY_DN74166_c0_g1~~TRINITY_DN74166_c0_g1_i1.p1  ORF type:complete len:505 (-),score=135.72 TRINITY_DN74166_c0_g1_i1:140-1654(-)